MDRVFIEKVKKFFRQHIIIIGLVAALIPLMALLGMQYQSLSKLQATMPAYQNELFKKYLTSVTEDISEQYYYKAEELLAVPNYAIPNRVNGIVQTDGDRNKLVNLMQDVAEHFKTREFEGAKRYFVAFAVKNPKPGGESLAVTLFYNPEKKAMEFRDDTPEWRAIQVAFAPFLLYIRSEVAVDSRPQGLERDRNHPLILKPITEKDKIIGIAGMILNRDYFLNQVVPKAIDTYLPKVLPDSYKNTIVTVREYDGELIYSTRPYEGKEDEAHMTGFEFVFRRLMLGVVSWQAIDKNVAQRSFYISLSLSILMTALLITAIGLTFRAASREMRLSQMKADFVSNVSHELRTPLSSIRVFGEFLRLGRVKDEKKIREYGEYIETESRRLTRLIDNILDFSKIESGRKTYQFVEGDIVEVISDTLKAFEVRLQQNGFIVDFDRPATPLPKAIIDQDAIAQAFINLLDNAVKYSGEEKKIDVEISERDDYITISVTDYGIGIPREERDKIFDKFYRVSTGLVHDVKGSGLGLSIVKHIVEAHNGLVTVSSRTGQGSTFTIHIPAEMSAGAKNKKEGKTSGIVADLATSK
ncbi:MAG: HAMP domain-containing sensor histidine kinase [Acidobacteriota bacterium]